MTVPVTVCQRGRLVLDSIIADMDTSPCFDS
jgi:hypothetical protein